MMRFRLLAAAAVASVCAATFARARPTPRQVEWADCEIGVIIHQDVQVYEPSYVDHADTNVPPAAVFNPTSLDTDQWLETAASAGAKYAVLVAKHCSGFSLWPTKAHGYSVAASPWRGGKGDIVADFIASCRKYGIKPGLYASAGRNNFFGVTDLKESYKTIPDEKWNRYRRLVCTQLTELWSNYGELFELWFDGGNLPAERGGREVEDLILKLQPKAVVFGGDPERLTCCRWVGNENAISPEDCWSRWRKPRDRDEWKRTLGGSPDGEFWCPVEADMPNRDPGKGAFQGGWFWRAGDEGTLHSPEDMLDRYMKCVGRNSNMMIGMVVDNRGLVPEADVAQLRRFGELVRGLYRNRVAKASGRGLSHEVALPHGALPSLVSIREDISSGENVRRFRLRGLIGETWRDIATGGTVGHRRLVPVAPAPYVRMRLEVEPIFPGEQPVIRDFEVFSDSALEVVHEGACDWKIVHGSAERDDLAARELQEIFERATGIRLEVRGGSEAESRGDGGVFLVGAEFADRWLPDEQTLVTARNGNIVLAGGGVAGTCYAVYDFCEKYFGYRLYGAYPGAEIVKKVDNLSWDGRDISTKPRFSGYRIDHANPRPRNEAEARFFRRNRNNAGDKPLTTRPMLAQHGHLLFVPPYDHDFTGFLGVKWRGMFREHPEYFSLDRSGRRTDKGQLCFSNPELRKLYISRFRQVVGNLGKGVYMVGSNDSHNERYCWCGDCARLMSKYRTNGGPLFDFLLELCENVRNLDGVYVATLAYKGPEQTELAPSGVVFPPNFVCDGGFLNSDRTVKAMAETVLPDGRVYNRFENLQEWSRITEHLAMWYYGGATPIQTYRRMQMEMHELAEAGVDSVGACGTGGCFEFGDVGTYMFYQLLRDPGMDADAAVMDVFRHKYGAAAQTIFGYLAELERYNIDNWRNPRWGFGCDDTYEKIPLEGEDLVRWQRAFDKALKLVESDPVRLANVKIARVGLDCWSIVYANRIRQAYPSFGLDVPVVLSRALEACDDAERRGIVSAKKNTARRSLSSLKYYSRLKTDALPAELSGEKPENVRLYLPEDPPHYFARRAPLTNDTLAAAGVAMFAAGVPSEEPIPVQLRDGAEKTWLLPDASIDPAKIAGGGYSVVSVGTARLPRSGMLVLADKWGTSLDIRTLGRFYDPSYHEKLYEYFVSVRLEGDTLFCDRVYLVDRGMPGEGRGVQSAAGAPAPSQAQVRFMSNGIMGIVHYGLNTYADREWGFGDTPPSVMDPASLNPEQWVVAAKRGGIKRLVLVAKHHEGFCLFPSGLNSDYTIANTPWKGGKGDVVREFRDACVKHGVEFGVYLSPWDRHQASYGTPAYAEYFQRQWDELLDGYGPIREIWLDGANGGDGWYGGAREKRTLPCAAADYYGFGRLVERLSRRYPLAVAFNGGMTPNCVVWSRTENGMNAATCWHDTTGAYLPVEADTPMRKRGWFWHPSDAPKSLGELVDVYFMTVGRNAVLNLGISPNRDGLVGDDDAGRLAEFGDYVRAFEGTDLAAGSRRTVRDAGGERVVDAELPEPRKFNAVDLSERLDRGQVVESWALEVPDGRSWRTLAKGTTVGFRRMERFDEVSASRVRVRARGRGGALPSLSVALRFAPAVGQDAADDFEQWRSPSVVTAISPDVLEFDFLRRVSVNHIQFLPPKDGRAVGVPDRYEVQVSDDRRSWTKVAEGEFGNLRANPVRQVQPLPADVAMRFARVSATRALEGSPQWDGCLLEFFKK